MLTNASLAAAVRALLPQLPAENVIAEPRAGGTAPALAWAAHEIARRGSRDDVMICVHADWAIGDDAEFRATLARAADVAEREQSLVTVGHRAGASRSRLRLHPAGRRAIEGARRVARFVEKPDRETRRADGARRLSLELGDLRLARRRFSRRGARALRRRSRRRCRWRESGDIEKFFASVTPISVDEGVLERSARVLVLPGDFGWDDVGTWAALHRVRSRDAQRQRDRSATCTRCTRRTTSCTRTRGRSCCTACRDLVVVTRDGLTLVTTKERAAELKQLLDALPPCRARALVTRALSLRRRARAQLRAVRADASRSARCAPGSRSCARGGSARSMRRRRDSSAPSICATSRRRARRRRRTRFARASIIANSRCIVPLGFSAHDADVWTCDGEIAAVRVASAVPLERARRRRAARSSRCARRERAWWTSRGDGCARCGSSSRTSCRSSTRTSRGSARTLTCAMPAGAIVIGDEARVRGAGRERRAAGGVRRDERPGARAARRARARVHATRGPVRRARERERARRSRERVLDRRVQRDSRRDLGDRSFSATRTRGTTASSATRISAGG